MATKYDPKCNLKPGQMVHIFGNLPDRGKSRPYIVLAVLYGGERFIATPVSTVIKKEGYKFLNEGNLANAPIHKFEIFNNDDIEDYKFSFFPHHEIENNEMLEIYHKIINGNFNPMEVPLWFEKREEVILDYLFDRKKEIYKKNYMKRFGLSTFGSDNSEPIATKQIEKKNRYEATKKYEKQNNHKSIKKEIEEVRGIKEDIIKENTKPVRILYVNEFVKKLIKPQHGASITINNAYTLYCRLASYFNFSPISMMEFKNEFDKEIIYGSKFTKVKIINSKYKNLDFKFPPNTNFKRLGLEIEPET